jgi:hypothetical protein
MYKCEDVTPCGLMTPQVCDHNRIVQQDIGVEGLPLGEVGGTVNEVGVEEVEGSGLSDVFNPASAGARVVSRDLFPIAC